MKRLIFTLCVLIALATADNATAFYNCVDSQGNSIITDNPPPGAKCKSPAGDDVSSSEKSDSASQRKQGDAEDQQAEPDDKTTSQQKEIKRLKKIPRVSY